MTNNCPNCKNIHKHGYNEEIMPTYECREGTRCENCCRLLSENKKINFIDRLINTFK